MQSLALYEEEEGFREIRHQKNFSTLKGGEPLPRLDTVVMFDFQSGVIKATFHMFIDCVCVVFKFLSSACFSIGMPIFYIIFKSYFCRKNFSTLRRWVGGCACSFSGALGVLSIPKDLPHPFLGPGPRAWWKIPGTWMKDRNDLDLGAGKDDSPCPPAGPAPCLAENATYSP